MEQISPRLTDPHGPPAETALAAFLGRKAYGYWQRLAAVIDRNYPGVFAPDWLFSRNLGWSLRYKKSKSFCTLIPERNALLVQIVLGAAERAKVEARRGEFSAGTWKTYEGAVTYHDGKWLLLTVASARTLADVVQLLAAKRKPRL
jgi:hypothetical protein